MNYEKSQLEIIKVLESMTGQYRLYNIFKDFLTLAAIEISNSFDKQHFNKREKLYIHTAKKYTKEEMNKFSEILALMTMGMGSGKMSDYIGELYMQLELGNKDSGQYFTPYEVSKLSVGMIGHKPNGKGIITLNEVSVGSGGMVIAFAEQLKLQDINYQEKLRVICNDIDHDVVKMAYIQLSLYGIDAIVMQGDTITNKMTEFWYTPMHFINLAREQEENKTKKKLHAMRQAMNLTVGQETKREADIKKTTKLINELEQIDIYDFIK